MRNVICSCAVLTALEASVALFGQTPSEELPARYIVSLKTGESVSAVAAEYGLIPRLAFQRAIHGFAIQVPAEQVAQMQSDPRIAAVIRDQRLGAFGEQTGSALHAAIASAVAGGIAVVVAAGNDPAKDVRDMVPSGFPEVIAVASTTARPGTGNRVYGSMRADTASWFTTDGPLDQYGIGVAISAPGEEREDIDAQRRINSVGLLSTQLGGGTIRMYGTSMAAPHVAGVVALLFEQNSDLLPVDAKISVMNGTMIMTTPYDSRSTRHCSAPDYSFDGDREGILSASNALAGPDGFPTKPRQTAPAIR